MKLVKSLLLGSAAALSTVAGAQAADLPVRKAAPVEYVSLCPAFGRGFWTIPGTDTCLGISGFARLEIGLAERTSREQDVLGWRARGRLNFDARTATAAGPVRAYIRLDARNDTGTPFAGNFARGFPGSTTAINARIDPISGIGTGRAVLLEQAYVQWGGLIAGRTTSFFNPGPRGDRFIGLRFDDAVDNELIGYNLDLTQGGQGFEIAVSAENALNRRTNTTAIAGFAGAGGNVVAPFIYEGQEWPDFVGRVTYKGTWGSAFVAGAVHQVADTGIAPGAIGPFFFSPVFGPLGGLPLTPRASADDEIGFAITGQVDVNLPFLAAGSLVWANATYADGALSYAGYGSRAGLTGFGFGSGTGLTNNPIFQALGLPVADAVVVNGSLETTEAFSFAGGLLHYFTPQLRANLIGSYSFVDFAEGTSGAGSVAGTSIGYVDFQEINIGGSMIYSPVAGLDLGVEVLYTNINPRGSIVVERPVTGGSATRTVRAEEDFLQGRLRISRNF